MGSVYIANTARAWVEYQVNGTQIQPGGPYIDVPLFGIVARTKDGVPAGTFALGDNTFTAAYTDVPPARGVCTYTLSTGGSVLDDLVLYVFRDLVLLMGARGEVLQTERCPGAPGARVAAPHPEGGGIPAPSTPRSPQEAAMSDSPETLVTTPGNVVVFNCYNEPVDAMTVNAGDGVPIGGWSPGGDQNPPLYTPSSVSVPRGTLPSEGVFGFGDNQVVVPWVSRGGAVIVSVSADGSVLDDLVLYVMEKQAVLVNTRGIVQGTFNVKPVTDGSQ
jgi:hypothetical protein